MLPAKILATASLTSNAADSTSTPTLDKFSAGNAIQSAAQYHFKSAASYTESSLVTVAYSTTTPTAKVGLVRTRYAVHQPQITADLPAIIVTSSAYTAATQETGVYYPQLPVPETDTTTANQPSETAYEYAALSGAHSEVMALYAVIGAAVMYL
jgi:hypothetical protein